MPWKRRIQIPTTRNLLNKSECLKSVFTIFYTESFQVPPEKNHSHLKCQSPPKILIRPKSLLYKRSEKWFSPTITQGGGGGRGCVQTITTIILWEDFLTFHSSSG